MAANMQQEGLSSRKRRKHTPGVRGPHARFGVGSLNGHVKPKPLRETLIAKIRNLKPDGKRPKKKKTHVKSKPLRETLMETIRNLKPDVKRTKKKKTQLIYKRLQHALALTRKQGRRYSELTSGRLPNGVRYQFVCGVCEANQSTFRKLKKHVDAKHKSNGPRKETKTRDEKETSPQAESADVFKLAKENEPQFDDVSEFQLDDAMEML